MPRGWCGHRRERQAFDTLVDGMLAVERYAVKPSLLAADALNEVTENVARPRVALWPAADREDRVRIKVAINDYVHQLV